MIKNKINFFLFNFKNNTRPRSLQIIKYISKYNFTWKNKTKEELKKSLSDMEFYVTQEKGTERPFTGDYVYNKENGIYTCIICDNPLFRYIDNI